MTDKPPNGGRKADGTFARGNRVGSAGKLPGTRHKVTLAVEALLQGQHAALTQKAINKALEGDTVALRLCLDRIAPPRRDAPITIDLPAVKNAADAVTAGSAVMAALSAGEATPDEAARVMAILTAQKGLIETCDLESRIVELERRRDK